MKAGSSMDQTGLNLPTGKNEEIGAAGTGGGKKPLRLEDLAPSIADILSCSICTCMLHEPVSILGCMHSFCGGCLSKWIIELGNQVCCPTIRQLKSRSTAMETDLSNNYSNSRTERIITTHLAEVQT